MLKDARLETRQQLFEALKENGVSIDIYDNAGATVDRYTIYFYDADYPDGGYIVTCSENPNDPTSGIWIHGELADQNLEKSKKISIPGLPEMVVQQIIKEVKGE